MKRTAVLLLAATLLAACGSPAPEPTPTVMPSPRPTATPSGSGGRIAFLSYRDNNNDIYVMNADGTGQTRLTDNPANDYSPTWSP